MKLVPFRPYTVEAIPYGERWFPFLFKTTSGRLLMYIEYGFDAHWSPFYRVESMDNGLTWFNPCTNVPRASWCHSFADGELFEVDTYGVQDPFKPDESVFFGAWSHPDRPGDKARRDFVRVRSSSLGVTKLTDLRGYPTHHWWSLWNTLHKTDFLRGDEVHIRGPYFTSGIETTGGRLLASAYWDRQDPSPKKNFAFIFESRDRGRSWDEVGVINDPDPKTPCANEVTLVRLKTGQLYVVARTVEGPGGPLMHSWSEDEGRTWTRLTPIRLKDSSHVPAHVWPVAKVLQDGTLVLVYGRPGKHIVFDPTGTGREWQGHLDLHAWEIETQAINGVPEPERLRGVVGRDVNACERHADSGDYLGVVETGPRELLVAYDVHQYVEHSGARPCEAIRLVKVRLEG